MQELKWAQISLNECNEPKCAKTSPNKPKEAQISLKKLEWMSLMSWNELKWAYMSSDDPKWA